MPRFILTALFSCCLAVLSAQSAATVERLARMGQVWGVVQYFHPDFAYRTVEWDSVFLEVAPAVLAAENERQFHQALQKMLAGLNDPFTRLEVRPTEPDTSAARELTAEFLDEGVLLITISDPDRLPPLPRLAAVGQRLRSRIDSASAVILDLRFRRPARYPGQLSEYFEYLGLNDVFADRRIHKPAFLQRLHYGFAPESGASSGGYFSGVYLTQAVPVAPRYPGRRRPVAFLINERTDLPELALSLQQEGVAVILSDRAELRGVAGRGVILPIGPTARVVIRTAEVLLPDGALPAEPDYRLWPSDEAVEEAQRLLRNPPLRPVAENPVNIIRTPSAAPRDYEEVAFPDLPQRLLAAARIYTVIRQFFPYRELMDDDWDRVYRQALPDFINAENYAEYGQAVFRFYAHIQDGHGFITGPGAQEVWRSVGSVPPPFVTEWIEDKVVITGLRSDSLAAVHGFAVGDEVLARNGRRVSEWIAEYSGFFAVSTPQALNKAMGYQVTRQQREGTATFRLRKPAGDTVTVTVPMRRAFYQQTPEPWRRPREVIERLSDQVGYADLTRLTVGQVSELFESFRDTRALILDLRGYPQGTAGAIAGRLLAEDHTAAARFEKPVLLGPRLDPEGQRESYISEVFFQSIRKSGLSAFPGKLVVLINENAVSQAEHTCLFLEAAAEVTFIGSPTAGANGDITGFWIPGGLYLNFSGQGVSYADGRPLQRTGIQPDIRVRPTIEGVMRGEDEVLTRALQFLGVSPGR